jgi:hypothetical protein
VRKNNNGNLTMNHAILLNIAIILVVAFALFVTNNPLVLMCLLLLKEMPYGLLAIDEDEDDESKPIGFVHHEEKPK